MTTLQIGFEPAVISYRVLLPENLKIPFHGNEDVAGQMEVDLNGILSQVFDEDTFELSVGCARDDNILPCLSIDVDDATADNLADAAAAMWSYISTIKDPKVRLL